MSIQTSFSFSVGMACLTISAAMAQNPADRHPAYDVTSPRMYTIPMPATELRIAPATEQRLTGSNVYPFVEDYKSEVLKLEAWRGERCGAQLAVSAGGGSAKLRVSCSPLRMGDKTINATARMIRYTLADKTITADIIGNENQCDHPVGVNRAVWFEVNVPQDAAPGLYKGTVTASAPGCEPITQEVELQVTSGVLPTPDKWQFHLDLWQHPQAVARWHDVEPWSRAHFEIMRPLMKRLAEAGQKCITCTLLDEAWNGQTYDWFPSMVRWVKGKDGVMRYDYSALDAWIHFMHDEIGIQEQISCYTMIPWHLSVKYYDEATGQYSSVKAKPGTPEYAALWTPFLQDFRRHMQEKGWANKTCIAIDERPDEYVRAAMKLVRENAPEFRIASAVDKPSELTREVYNISPVLTHAGTALGSLLRERKAAGKITTFYVCLHPLKPNTFTHSVPAEAEWLGLFAAANNLDGFLRWAYNSWNRNPFETTDFGNWPSGDCFLVYPGNRTSIRFERLRDGIEEYEKIQILRSRAAESPAAVAAVDAMNRELEEIFTVERSTENAHTADVNRARAIISRTLKVLELQNY